MGDSLRDQLLALGLGKRAPEPRPAARERGGPRRGSVPAGQPVRPGPASGAGAAAAGGGRSEGEIDLARAYALRARSEREAREAAEREARERARARRERKERLARLLEGKSLNRADAELARHFEHAGKIRRVYVTAEQLAALNRGELGVVANAGRYVLVAREVALAAAELWPETLLLLPDPAADRDDDVPPDLIW